VRGELIVQNEYNQQWYNLAFPQSGGTRASKIQLKISSRLVDMTMRPWMPFSKSVREDLSRMKRVEC
jgi:hypothetical protein